MKPLKRPLFTYLSFWVVWKSVSILGNVFLVVSALTAILYLWSFFAVGPSLYPLLLALMTISFALSLVLEDSREFMSTLNTRRKNATSLRISQKVCKDRTKTTSSPYPPYPQGAESEGGNYANHCLQANGSGFLWPLPALGRSDRLSSFFTENESYVPRHYLLIRAN